MAESKGGKTGLNDETVQQNSSEREIERGLYLPKSFRDKGLHEVWGPDGPAGLFRRLEQESKLGRGAPQPLSNEELAQFVELCDGEPLPSALRNLVIRGLRNKRHERRGPKADLSPVNKLKQLLLPALYENGMLVARRYRRRLLLIEKRKKRRHLAEQIPTDAEVALRYVQKWLPSSSKTLANKLSALKDPSEKKPRAKSAKR